MLEATEIRTPELLEEVLPLIDAYQEFYGFESNRERNRVFFRSLIGAQEGRQFAALQDGKVVGFATLYFLRSSLTGGSYAVMNDLFSLPTHRNLGVGRKLIQACGSFALQQGYSTLEWQTQEHNHRAQRLYDTLGAQKSQWFTYSLGL